MQQWLKETCTAEVTDSSRIPGKHPRKILRSSMDNPRKQRGDSYRNA